eukprot:CAMPEP_0113909798 /NCGR_PEP_ID=MMETSP0780_2-20120614/27088_1 /TAXON_ID=652834 /ORGANISM="Palpitomonas bilix" /LENGTH=712 /DNA_ID=CAMNT_0000905719 /DNA_START=363 /DNA_END=2498 /DNA_ORIENTATION=+ /assembly_acc=CAM_ASM_000599
MATLIGLVSQLKNSLEAGDFMRALSLVKDCGSVLEQAESKSDSGAGWGVCLKNTSGMRDVVLKIEKSIDDRVRLSARNVLLNFNGSHYEKLVLSLRELVGKEKEEAFLSGELVAAISLAIQLGIKMYEKDHSQRDEAVVDDIIGDVFSYMEQLPEESGQTCFLYILREVSSFLLSFERLTKWRPTAAEDSYDLFSQLTTLWERSRILFWKNVETSIATVLHSIKASNIRKFLDVSEASLLFLHFGEVFSGRSLDVSDAPLGLALNQKAESVFAQLHSEKMSFVRQLLNVEMWTLMPLDIELSSLATKSRLTHISQSATRSVVDEAKRFFSAGENPFENFLVSGKAAGNRGVVAVSTESSQFVGHTVTTTGYKIAFDCFQEYLEVAEIVPVVAWEAVEAIFDLHNLHCFAIWKFFGVGTRKEAKSFQRRNSMLLDSGSGKLIGGYEKPKQSDSAETSLQSGLSAISTPSRSMRSYVNKLSSRFTSSALSSKETLALSQSVDISSPSTLFGMSSRTAALQSYLFLVDALYMIKERMEGAVDKRKLDGLEDLFKYNVANVSLEFQKLMAIRTASMLVESEPIIGAILDVKWESKEFVVDSSAGYVKMIGKQLEIIGSQMKLLGSSQSNHIAEWEAVVDVLVMTLLDGYARIRKISDVMISKIVQDAQVVLVILKRVIPEFTDIMEQCTSKLKTYAEGAFILSATPRNPLQEFLAW